MHNIKFLLNLHTEIINGLKEEISDSSWKYSIFIADEIRNLLINNNYGDAISKLTIIPILYSKKFIEIIEKDTGKKIIESIFYKPKIKDGFVSLHIDYEKFLISDEKQRKQMILQNIIDSILALDEKIKKHKDVEFKGKELIKDILDKIVI